MRPHVMSSFPLNTPGVFSSQWPINYAKQRLQQTVTAETDAVVYMQTVEAENPWWG